MKKSTYFIRIILLAIIICLYPFGSEIAFAGQEPEIIASSAVLMDMETGKILYSKRMHEKKYPASTTKIMTAILALESFQMNKEFTASREEADIEPTRIAMHVGEVFTAEQLINVMLIRSANDTALLLSKGIDGNTDKFIVSMNSRAKELGALNTNFTNPHGLPDENHVTTAYDLAMMARYAMSIPRFRQIVQTAEYTLPPTNQQAEPRVVKSTNELMFNIKNIMYNGKKITTKYEGATGIKTGYTSQAGRCFVASAMKNGRELVCVVMQSDQENCTLDTIKLLDYGFANFENRTVAEGFSGDIKVKSGKSASVELALKDDPIITIERGKFDEKKIYWEAEIENYITAPVSKGQIVGKYNVYVDDLLERQVDIITQDNVEVSSWVNIFDTLKSTAIKLAKPAGIILGVIVLLALLCIIWIVRLHFIRAKKRQRRSPKPAFQKTKFR